MRRTLSATPDDPNGRALRVEEDRERGGNEVRLERRVAPGLAVELHGALRALEHLDPHGVAAPEPQSPCAVRRAPQQLHERAQALERALRAQREHVEPAV